MLKGNKESYIRIRVTSHFKEGLKNFIESEKNKKYNSLSQFVETAISDKLIKELEKHNKK